MQLVSIPEFDSKEELLFHYYVLELLDGGWLKKATYHPESFTLTEDVHATAMIEKKNFNAMKDVKLMSGHKYTADWYLEWDRKAHRVFYWLGMGVYKQGFYPYSKSRADMFIPFKAEIDEYGKVFSIIDVKGEVVGRNNTSAITFPLNQKMLYSKEGLFVQKVVISLGEKSLFNRTFTPRFVISSEVYKKDCKYGKKGESKLKYEPRLLQNWIKLKNGNTN